MSSIIKIYTCDFQNTYAKYLFFKIIKISLHTSKGISPPVELNRTTTVRKRTMATIRAANPTTAIWRGLYDDDDDSENHNKCSRKCWNLT